MAHRCGKGYMETTDRPMDTLKATLDDKTVQLQKVKVRGEGEEDGEGEGEGMTLDVMVTCEVCGHHQRVGKRR